MQTPRTIASILGGKQAIGRTANSPLAFDRLIREGLPWSAVLQIKETLRLSDREVAQILGVSERTLSRMKKTGHRLPHTASDRLYRLARIFALACEVLESPPRALTWLRQPQVGLGRRIPLDLLQTEAGTQEVEDLLGRIEHSVLA